MSWESVVDCGIFEVQPQILVRVEVKVALCANCAVNLLGVHFRVREHAGLLVGLRAVRFGLALPSVC